MGFAELNTQSILINPLAVQDDDTSEVLWGLQQKQKTLPAKYFYDQRGSNLFDQICDLDAYYLSRTETAIMRRHIGDIAEMVDPNSILIEYGSGSSVKTRFLLDNLPTLAAYIPVDISQEHLFKTAESLGRSYPNLMVSPLWADFTKQFTFPWFGNKLAPRFAYFPGSTIGNFYPQQAIEFMRDVARIVGPGGGFLIGFDLQKDPAILNQAYNDPEGITAAFNLNMLNHINKKFHADFNEHLFDHLAFYNSLESRIEMHLVSKKDQRVTISGVDVNFFRGESILTEVSHKYTSKGFARMARQAGFKVQGVWVDPKNYFSVQYLKQDQK